MAKRKRLTPAQPGHLAPSAPETRALPAGPLTAAPIAQVAGEAATTAALDELSATLRSARAEGRLMDTLPLTAIDTSHLTRDRMVQSEEEMQALLSSLEARGQQTPIDVVALATPRDGFTHGLISGWRRLNALKRLYDRDQDPRFGSVKALVSTPDSAQAAYVAMVEENEIRADLSFYERGRIVWQAQRNGVYDSRRAALQGLFGAVSRSKRSKIGSFANLAEAFDPVLRFPTSISEKLGLALAKKLASDPTFETRLIAALQGDPVQTAPEEMDRLSAALRGVPQGSETSETEPMTLRYDARRRQITLSGEAVTPELFAALQGWLSDLEQG